MKSLWSRWRGQPAALSESEVRELTAQFYVTLEAYFAKVKSTEPLKCQDAREQVERLLTQEPRNWTNAYAVEQLLVHLFDEETVESELQIRVQETKGALRPTLVDYYTAEIAKENLLPDRRRALLGRIINDLQWRYTVNEVKRSYTKEITLKTSQLFIGSMLLFVLCVLATLCFPVLEKVDVRLLVPAILAGCWGASFSMLSSSRDRLAASDLDDLKLLRARWVLSSRVLIGAGASSVLYFFFVSGMLTGAAFPDFSIATSTPSPIDSVDWLKFFSLLVVWSFVAGFSERMIPGLLARTETSLESSTAPDRFRPPSAVAEVGNPQAPQPATVSTAAAQAQPPAAESTSKPAGS